MKNRSLMAYKIKIKKVLQFVHCPLFLPELARDPFSKTTPLEGTLKGERPYHFGRKPEYRIIFYPENNLITVTIIGTREGIYKRAKRRKK